MGLISRVSSRTYRSLGLPNNPTSKNIKMVFKKFVEIGRVVYIKESNQIAAICDVIDSNHVIIDAPTVNRAGAAADIDGQWAGSNWAKTLAKKALRASANDFQRFKVMKLKQARREIINKQK